MQMTRCSGSNVSFRGAGRWPLVSAILAISASFQCFCQAKLTGCWPPTHESFFSSFSSDSSPIEIRNQTVKKRKNCWCTTGRKTNLFRSFFWPHQISNTWSETQFETEEWRVSLRRQSGRLRGWKQKVLESSRKDGLTERTGGGLPSCPPLYLEMK